jgi:uncharacterized protein (DUF1810 family)
MPIEDDPFNLQRFVDAQASVYRQVLEELRRGSKASHWMWFVFPQIAGLGRSSTAAKYAIGDLAEAKAYLAHPTLGPRLIECTSLVLPHSAKGAKQVFGSPDDVKFKSSMTLFDLAAQGSDIFSIALMKFFDGQKDAATMAKL